MSHWTQEERDRAAEDLTRSQEDNGCNPSVYSIGGYGYEVWAIDLQCSLNRLQERDRQARELLSDTLGQSGSYPMRIAWQKRKSEWLSRNK